jgi:hypothetical protein
MNRSIKFLLTVLTLGLGLSACHGTGNTTIYQDPYYRAWYDVYGYYCGDGYPTAGCNFYADGSKILMSEDPYYRSGITLYNDYWTYTDSFGFRRSYLGFAWLSPSGILYDQFGNALNESESDSVSADVITAASEKERQIQTSAGKALAQKYALNEDRGIEISKTLQDWAKLGKDRARSDADVLDFSRRLFGVSGSRAESALAVAMTTRSLKAVEELNVDVAAHWGTTPEVSKRILQNWYRDESKALGY